MSLKFNFHENQKYWPNECEISFEKYLLTSKFEKQKESDPSDIYFMISMIFWKKSTLIFTYHGTDSELSNAVSNVLISHFLAYKEHHKGT